MHNTRHTSKGIFIDLPDFKMLMSDQKAGCKISLLPHPLRGIELELRGDCSDALKIIEGLPPRRRRYMQRRIKKVD